MGGGGGGGGGAAGREEKERQCFFPERGTLMVRPVCSFLLLLLSLPSPPPSRADLTTRQRKLADELANAISRKVLSRVRSHCLCPFFAWRAHRSRSFRLDAPPLPRNYSHPCPHAALQDVLKFFIETAQFEFTLKNMFQALLRGKRERWDTLKKQCTDRMTELGRARAAPQAHPLACMRTRMWLHSSEASPPLKSSLLTDFPILRPAPPPLPNGCLFASALNWSRFGCRSTRACALCAAEYFGGDRQLSRVTKNEELEVSPPGPPLPPPPPPPSITLRSSLPSFEPHDAHPPRACTCVPSPELVQAHQHGDWLAGLC